MGGFDTCVMCVYFFLIMEFFLSFVWPIELNVELELLMAQDTVTGYLNGVYSIKALGDQTYVPTGCQPDPSLIQSLAALFFASIMHRVAVHLR